MSGKSEGTIPQHWNCVNTSIESALSVSSAATPKERPPMQPTSRPFRSRPKRPGRTMPDPGNRGPSGIHYVSPVLPVCLGHGKASARGSPARSRFSGGPGNGGARTGTVRGQSRSFADAGRRKCPDAVPRQTGRTGEHDRSNHPFVVRRRRSNAVIQTIAQLRARSGR
jgi:hypothetical protein